MNKKILLLVWATLSSFSFVKAQHKASYAA